MSKSAQKYKYTETKNPLLIGIYKAGQCCDLNDVEIALAQLDSVKQKLKNVRGISRAVYIRERSLLKKYKKIYEKSVQP